MIRTSIVCDCCGAVGLHMDRIRAAHILRRCLVENSGWKYYEGGGFDFCKDCLERSPGYVKELLRRKNR